MSGKKAHCVRREGAPKMCAQKACVRLYAFGVRGNKQICARAMHAYACSRPPAAEAPCRPGNSPAARGGQGRGIIAPLA